MPDEIKIELDLPGVNIEDLRDSVLDVFQAELLTALKDNSPVDKGYLREHWFEGDRRSNQVELYNNTIYALWLVRGTGLYGPYRTPICASGVRYAGTIMAIGKPKFLHWKDKSGRDIFRKCVKGIKPMTFVEDGIKEGTENAIAALKEMFRTPGGLT